MDTDTLPISVVIPAYNRAELTARAVTSALGQRPYPPAEVLVVDDASNDRTDLAATAAGATVVRHRTNRGRAAARNTGLSHASQEWVALLDSDDEWLPHHLASLASLRTEGTVLVASSALACGDAPAGDAVWGVGGRVREIRSPADLLVHLNYVVTSAAMVRRAEALAAGGFDENRRLCEDLELWLRLLDRGSGRVSPDVSVRYRLHDGQVSADRDEMRHALRDVMGGFVDRPWLRPTDVERTEGAMAWDELRLALRTRDREAALPVALRLVRNRERVRGAIGLVWWRRRLAYAQRGISRVGSSVVADLAVCP